MSKIVVDDSVLKMALEALDWIGCSPEGYDQMCADRDAAQNALRTVLQNPTPPPEAQTEAEKIAYCAGWWAALSKQNSDSVYGDVLPPIGSRVFILHGRDDDAHACIVTGYYAWNDLKGDKHLHRVFVRMVYEDTDTPQSRMLCDCYPTAKAALESKNHE